jgi:hypothetical protein
MADAGAGRPRGPQRAARPQDGLTVAALDETIRKLN